MAKTTVVQLEKRVEKLEERPESSSELLEQRFDKLLEALKKSRSLKGI